MIDMSFTEAQSDAKVTALLKTLCETWHNTIPVSKFMGITPVLFNGDSLKVALYCDEIMCATFTGQFVSLPQQSSSVD